MADIRMKYAYRLKGGSENPDVRYLAEARALQDEYFDMEWGNNDDDPNDDILRARTIAIIERLEHIFYHIVLSPHVANEIEEIIQNVANDWADDNDTNVIEGGFRDEYENENILEFVEEIYNTKYVVDTLMRQYPAMEELPNNVRGLIRRQIRKLDTFINLIEDGTAEFTNAENRNEILNFLRRYIASVEYFLNNHNENVRPRTRYGDNAGNPPYNPRNPFNQF
jgi:hypothetical protein